MCGRVKVGKDSMPGGVTDVPGRQVWRHSLCGEETVVKKI